MSSKQTKFDSILSKLGKIVLNFQYKLRIQIKNH